MKRDIKSIFYAFVSEDIEVYSSEENENCFHINHLVCSDCGAFWHTALLECYLCGEINYYLYTCSGCGKQYSITKSKIKCDCETTNAKLLKKCINPECLSNSNDEIGKLAAENNGVFELHSSFNLALMHCIKCGGIKNHYKNYLVYIINCDKDKDISQFIKLNSVKKGDIIIFKEKISEELKYDYVKYEGNPIEKLGYPYSRISEIVEKLYQ